MEAVAEYTHAFDPAKAQEILLSASQLNNNVAKPIAGVKYAKLTRKGRTQADAAVEHMRSYKSENDLLLAVNAIIEDLIWDENRTKEFEAAIFDLGGLLGLDSQRPEQKYKSGPDNLWSIGDLSYIVIECKSGAKSPTISKSDCDQLGGSVKWFFDHYDKSCTAAPLMIHPYYTFDNQASPIDAIRIMDTKHLNLLHSKLREYAAAISGSGSIRKSDAIEKHLKHFGFMGSDFLSQYSRSFLKQS